jgi:hypothetical protein
MSEYLDPVTAEDHAKGINLNWCIGCCPDNCMGCGNGTNPVGPISEIMMQNLIINLEDKGEESS